MCIFGCGFVWVCVRDTVNFNLCFIPSVGSNPGDWWTALESEPSMGSTTQLHVPVSYRGPELGLLEVEGPYLNVNKGVWLLLML